jgi:Xaa-Pro aminopeptidase
MTTYVGDTGLGSLLVESGSNLSLAEVRRLIAGICAAPAAMDSRSWLDLVRESSSKALDEQLLALHADIAQASEFGLEQPKPPKTRLSALRAELKRRGIDGFIIPRADEHQGEYVPPCASRLEWLTGFSGSAGAAVVLTEAAAIFIDGRYTLQVEAETDTQIFSAQHLVKNPVSKWLGERVTPGQKIAFDPWLHTLSQVRKLRVALEKKGATLVSVESNPLDAVWGEQPSTPISPVRVQELAHSGQSSEDKRKALAKTLSEDGGEATVLSLPDSIAWLLNVRGADIPRTPFPLSFAIAFKSGDVHLFIDQRKVTESVRKHLGKGVRLFDRSELAAELKALASAKSRVWIDPSSIPQWVVDRLAGALLVERVDPCALPKACKNPVELEGTRQAHIRDGVAVTRFLAWLDATCGHGTTTELEASDYLEACRRRAPELRDLSFDTISGAGPNGAIVHYRANETTNRLLEQGSLYLVDSGGQYPDGTTDITRTIAVGVPSAEMKDRFTRVLQGHINLARARFPHGTTGSHLDTLARFPLWQVGVDYDHGTGHGVGSYLSVHEGPQRISKAPNTVALREGMILSNEPGYYKTGAYGIRIENLVVVRPCSALDNPERAMLEFETITMAPIDRTLVDVELLTTVQLDWLNAYHQEVRAKLENLLDGEELAFLMRATEPLSR